MKNAEFYKRVHHPPPGAKERHRRISWSQLLLILALGIFFFPFYPGRRGHHGFPENWSAYVDRAGIGLAIAIVICLVVLWVCTVQPFFERTFYYIFEGVFEVVDKVKSSQRRIMLRPGTNHFVSVDRHTFNNISIGDKVLVRRRKTGEIVHVEKVVALRTSTGLRNMQ